MILPAVVVVLAGVPVEVLAGHHLHFEVAEQADWRLFGRAVAHRDRHVPYASRVTREALRDPTHMADWDLHATNALHRRNGPPRSPH